MCVIISPLFTVKAKVRPLFSHVAKSIAGFNGLQCHESELSKRRTAAHTKVKFLGQDCARKTEK